MRRILERGASVLAVLVVGVLVLSGVLLYVMSAPAPVPPASLPGAPFAGNGAPPPRTADPARDQMGRKGAQTDWNDVLVALQQLLREKPDLFTADQRRLLQAQVLDFMDVSAASRHTEAAMVGLLTPLHLENMQETVRALKQPVKPDEAKAAQDLIVVAVKKSGRPLPSPVPSPEPALTSGELLCSLDAQTRASASFLTAAQGAELAPLLSAARQLLKHQPGDAEDAYQQLVHVDLPEMVWRTLTPAQRDAVLRDSKRRRARDEADDLTEGLLSDLGSRMGGASTGSPPPSAKAPWKPVPREVTDPRLPYYLLEMANAGKLELDADQWARLAVLISQMRDQESLYDQKLDALQQALTPPQREAVGKVVAGLPYPPTVTEDAAASQLLAALSQPPR